MRFLTFAVLSSLLVAGVTVAEQGSFSRSTELNSVNANQPHLLGTNNRRDTSYRGSGRRAILAFPTSHLASEA